MLGVCTTPEIVMTNSPEQKLFSHPWWQAVRAFDFNGISLVGLRSCPVCD